MASIDKRGLAAFEFVQVERERREAQQGHGGQGVEHELGYRDASRLSRLAGQLVVALLQAQVRMLPIFLGGAVLACGCVYRLCMLSTWAGTTMRRAEGSAYICACRRRRTQQRCRQLSRRSTGALSTTTCTRTGRLGHMRAAQQGPATTRGTTTPTHMVTRVTLRAPMHTGLPPSQAATRARMRRWAQGSTLPMPQATPLTPSLMTMWITMRIMGCHTTLQGHPQMRGSVSMMCPIPGLTLHLWRLRYTVSWLHWLPSTRARLCWLACMAC